VRATDTPPSLTITSCYCNARRTSDGSQTADLVAGTVMTGRDDTLASRVGIAGVSFSVDRRHSSDAAAENCP
jgi:hypothetical protein